MMSHDDISYTAIPLSTDSSISKSLPHPSNPEQRQVEWRISPWTPLATINLFIAGVLVCIGHHLFYTRLDGTPVRTLEDGSKYYTQTWIIRYGTAFAFLAKVLLAGSVVVAYKQRIWVDLRCRAHKIETIDAIFAATYDLTALMNPTLFLGAKLPLIMALIAWLLPFAALVTPSTLTVVLALHETSRMEYVPTLDLNSTGVYEVLGLGDDSSPLLSRLTSTTATSMEIIHMSAIGPNTTYYHQFVGPSYKCRAIISGSKLANMTEVINETRKKTRADYVAYLAFGAHNLKSLSPPSIFDYCIGSGHASNCTAAGSHQYMSIGNESVECVPHETQYNITFQAVGNVQMIRDVQFRWLSPVKWTEKESTFRNHPYKLLQVALGTMLNGAIVVSGGPKTVLNGTTKPGIITTYRTRVLTTSLIGKVRTGNPMLLHGVAPEVPLEEQQMAANRTLAKMLQELSRNQTLSLFSSNRFWLPQNATNTTLVNRTAIYNKYEYEPRNLIMTYSIAVAFSLFGVMLGLRAVWLNGVCHDTSFSSIMSTTRNHCLDELSLGHSLGSTPIPSTTKNVKLRFGELKQAQVSVKGQLVTRAAFGGESEIATLKKGQVIC